MDNTVWNRRSKIADVSALAADLQQRITSFHGVLKADDTLRGRTKALVPIHHLIRDLGSSLVPDKSAKSGRARILYYLKAHIGQVIHGDELMVVSGISEYGRRARELRVEYGWQVMTGNTINDIREDDESAADLKELPSLKPDEYILLSDQQDTDAARRWKIAKEIRNEKISVLKKILKYLQLNVGKPISGEELRYIAKDTSEWARRVRELRTQYGWSVVTKATGRPDLPVGVYLLEDLRQAPEHDRNIKDEVRGIVLRRDKYKCQDCDWSRDIWNPDDPRHLEVHHVIMHVEGGANTAENLITLCNICHDVRHRKEKVA